MGKKLRSKEEKRRKAERAVAALLQAHSRNSTSNEPAAALADFAPERQEAIRRYAGHALRPPAEWRCAIKSRSADRRFVALVRFMFVRYPAPRHLEGAWVDARPYVLAEHHRRIDDPYAAGSRVDLRFWYILAAQGGSLHRHATGAFFTKTETHHFLTAPPSFDSVSRAFWYAVARAQNDDPHLAQRIAATKLVDYSVGSAFWRDVARFFARNPMTLAEMNDLVDFLAAAREEDERFSLKGRTVDALRRRMEAWHRALRQAQSVCGGSWPGHPLPDIAYEAGSDERKAIWRFRQIKTGNELFHEGRRMHHCVVTYKGRCMADQTSIWSLTSEFPLGCVNRGITIELRRNGAIVQARGFANRLPHANEGAMVRRWAQDHGLALIAM